MEHCNDIQSYLEHEKIGEGSSFKLDTSSKVLNQGDSLRPILKNRQPGIFSPDLSATAQLISPLSP